MIRSLLSMADRRFWDASSVELSGICTSPSSSRLLFLADGDTIEYSGCVADGISLLQAALQGKHCQSRPNCYGKLGQGG